jgi:glyoxylase-like metal-dependent hydrolase (beta-lactamase superfamily II)
MIYVLVDCGPPKKSKAFIKHLQATGIKPEDIQLIIITHGHWDHIGSAADIKEVTGAKIAMHHREKDWLEKQYQSPPKGVGAWGSFLAKTMAAVMTPFIHVRSAGVDVVLEDTIFSLNDYGIAGRIVYTPGHTAGSVSILLDTGEAIVGDMAMNSLPMRLSPGLPIFAENLPQLIESWRKLLKEDVKSIYPSHGGPFSPDIMRKALS